MVRGCWRTVTDNGELTGDANALVVIIDVWGCVDGVHLPSSRLMVRQLIYAQDDRLDHNESYFRKYRFFNMATKVEAEANIQHSPTVNQTSSATQK